ncbi:MAG: GNAT family N-acetyltransferase [Rhodomicrobium sp.]
MSVTRRVAVPSEIALQEPSSKGASLAIADRAGLAQVEAWKNAFQSQRKDRRYYEIVEDTICPEFTYRYFLIQDETGRTRSVQPYFILDQDILAGLGPRWQKIAGAIRRIWPRFLFIRTLMVGCAAGEAHFSSPAAAAQQRDAETLSARLRTLARKERASIIVMKEFPAQYRGTLRCFLERGFTRVPSMPMTRLDVSDYKDFDDYLAKAIKSKRRNEFRRKFKAAAQSAPIDMEVVPDVSDVIDELYSLYLQVYGRSKMHFEKLTKEYFVQLGRRMPDKTRFFLWRQNGKLIAFSLCLVEGDTLYGEYIGLDYSIALDIHLYFYVMRDTISWAIANGYKSIVSSGLSYAPKLQMAHVLEPLDLYVRHTSPLANLVMKRVLPLLEPTGAEPALQQFKNYNELWAENSPAV